MFVYSNNTLAVHTASVGIKLTAAVCRCSDSGLFCCDWSKGGHWHNIKS